MQILVFKDSKLWNLLDFDILNLCGYLKPASCEIEIPVSINISAHFWCLCQVLESLNQILDFGLGYLIIKLYKSKHKWWYRYVSSTYFKIMFRTFELYYYSLLKQSSFNFHKTIPLKRNQWKIRNCTWLLYIATEFKGWRLWIKIWRRRNMLLFKGSVQWSKLLSSQSYLYITNILDCQIIFLSLLHIRYTKY